MAGGHGVGMAHVRVDVHRLADIQHDRFVELGMHLGRAFEDVDVFLAGMADEVAKLGKATRAHARHHRSHVLAAQLRAQVVIIVVGRVDADRILDAADTASRGDRVLVPGSGFSEQLRHAHAKPLADLQQLVVGQGQAIMLDL